MNFIREQRKEKHDALIRKVLKTIGNSQMDLYTGRLSLAQITKEIKTNLLKKGCLEHDRFLQYLEDGYFTVMLSDHSVWVIREGKEPGRYIHIHPGRYSPETIRVKALTLKSFIAGAILAPDLSQIELEDVNAGRAVYLGEQPLKKMDDSSGVGRLVRLNMKSEIGNLK